MYLASGWRVILQPAAINQVVHVGQQITVQAEIVNRLDQPVAAAGVRVYLGQIIYAQQGLEYSEAFINNGLEGQTPVAALTNKARRGDLQDPLPVRAAAIRSTSRPTWSTRPISIPTATRRSCQ